MLDLTLYQYNPSSQTEDPVMPGLYTGLPPRHAARGREGDRLVLYLTVSDNESLPAETQREFLEKVTTLFYNTKGTVTIALKTVVDQLNDRLLARNIRSSKEVKPVTGLFQALVFHGDSIYLAQCGPAHTFVMGRDNAQHYYDPEGAGRGLGVSRSAGMRLYSSEIHPGDRVIFCANPPVLWTSNNLAGPARLSLESFTRWLAEQAAALPRFILLQFDRGKGSLEVKDLTPTLKAGLRQPTPVRFDQPQPQTPILSEEKDEAVFQSGEKPVLDNTEKATSISDSGEKVAGLFAGLIGGRKNVELEPRSSEPEEPASTPPEITESDSTGEPAAISTTTEPWSPALGNPNFSPQAEATAVTETVRSPEPRRAASRRTRTAIAGGLKGWRAFKARIADGLGKILVRIMPGQAENLPTVSPALMVFIAVAVPLIIVAVATTVYVQNGRNEQHQVFMAQSQSAFDQGQAQTDPVLRRVNYEAALDWVKKAEEYGATEESTALKIRIGDAIDSMDGITRFELQPALPNDFDASVNITQIWASQTEDLYLLDSNSGRVLRMVYTRPGYELDNQFTCGPGMIGSLIIGPLVDIVPAPSGNSFGAVILGVDASGNLLYCSTDTTRTMAVTLQAPDAGWGQIKAIAFQDGVLSILDVNSNAVWRFEGVGLNFGTGPRLFFDNDVPELAGAIDLAVYMDDLYILNQDGHMVLCTYSYVEVTPTRCTNPYNYRVSVPGQEVQELATLNAQFNQIQTTQPPEPSMFFLDVSGRSIQQFSLSLNYVRRLQPRTDGADALPDIAPSAFTITTGRNVVVAYGNQVFLAPLPAP